VGFFGKNKKMIHDVPNESFESLIGPSTQIFGRLVVNHGVRIDGEIHGSVEASRSPGITVHIGHEGVVKGDLHAFRVLVNGTVDGNIYAAERCDLFETSKVRGDIHYGQMGIEHGAEIYGELLKKGLSVTTSVTSSATTSKVKDVTLIDQDAEHQASSLQG
jgi:cytoskeletal protein CcmA (bactofilin family)